MKKKLDIFSNDNIHNVLRSSGYVRDPQEVNILEIFYSLYNTTPFVTDIDAHTFFLWDGVTEKINNVYTDIKTIFQNQCIALKEGVLYNKQQALELKKGLILVLEGNFSNPNYLAFKNIDMYGDDSDVMSEDGKDNYVTYAMILTDDDIEKTDLDILMDIFNSCKIKEEDKIDIGMVCVENGNYYVKNFNIKNSILDLVELDLHYGNGFEKFNTDLIERLTSKTKGLTLLHGDPGTGKTTFVRYLIKEIMKSNKRNNILYFPPTMVDFITEPSFINFVSEWVSDNDGKTYLLIEDAEPLLESRNQGRNLGITNLLNLTDGILNDIFNIQIIATFNTNLQNLDKALLRPERLLARKEFKELTIEHAKQLAEYLEIDKDLIKSKMSLADIYSLKKESKPLTHDIENSSRIGF